MKPSEYFTNVISWMPLDHQSKDIGAKILALLEAVEGVSIKQYKWNIDAARQQDETGFEYLFRAALMLKEAE